MATRKIDRSILTPGFPLYGIQDNVELVMLRYPVIEDFLEDQAVNGVISEFNEWRWPR